MIKKTIVLLLLLGFSTAIAFGMSVELGGNPFIDFSIACAAAGGPRQVFPMLTAADMTLIEPLSKNLSMTENIISGAIAGITAGSIGARWTTETDGKVFLSPDESYMEIDGGLLSAASEIFPMMDLIFGFSFEFTKNLNTYIQFGFYSPFSNDVQSNFSMISGLDWHF